MGILFFGVGKAAKERECAKYLSEILFQLTQQTKDPLVLSTSLSFCEHT